MSDPSRDSNGAVAPRPNGNGRLSPAPAAALGAGIMTVVLTLLQGQPELIARVVDWGPGVIVLGGFMWLANRWAGPLVESQQRMAANMGEMAGALRENLNKDEDVRGTLRVLAGNVNEMREELREHLRGKVAE